MRGLGQISDLASVADIGIITNVHPVHLELLGSLENVARAKAELVAGLRPGGTAVVPADCEPLEKLLDGLQDVVASSSFGSTRPSVRPGVVAMEGREQT